MKRNKKVITQKKIDVQSDKIEQKNKKIRVQSDKIEQKNKKIDELEIALKYVYSIVDTVREPLLVLYPGLHIKTANKSFYQTFKVTPKDTLGQLIYTIGNEQWNIPKLKNLLEKVLPRKDMFENFEVVRKFEDIGKKTMLLNARQLNVGETKEQLILLAIEDITKLKILEQTVEKEHEKTLENIPSGVLVFDKKGRCTYGNKMTETIMRKKVKGILGKSIQNIFPKKEGLTFVKECQKAIQTGTSVSFEEFYSISNMWLKIQVHPSQLGLSVYFEDITKRKRIEEDLRQNEELYRVLFGSVPVAVFVCDSHAVIQHYNSRAVELCGREPKRGKDQYFGSLRLFLPDGTLLPHTQSPLTEVLRTGVSALNVEMFIERLDGSRIPVLVNFAALKDKKEQIIGSITSFVDISEQKLILRQRDEFIAIASHELKTPITSLKAYAQVLQKRFLDEGNTKSAEQLGKMDRQINKLITLITDLLDVTKIEAGKLRFHEDFFYFDELINEIVEEVQLTTNKQKIEIVGKEKRTIYSDRDRAGQVLTNLLTNAIKYSPLSHKIIVSTSFDKNNIKVCVQDFGIGIAKNMQPYIFEQFYRESGGGQETFSGLGLGLFVASEIVRRQDGRIWVESIKGKGSTFCFTLPMKNRKIKQRKNPLT